MQSDFVGKSFGEQSPETTMKTPRYPWSLGNILIAQPTVGALMALCEENYCHLMRLAPRMKVMEGCHHSQVEGHMDLHLEVLVRAPYTTLIHLTYYFDRTGVGTSRPDPDALLRVYHDAGQAEVLDLEQQALPVRTPPGRRTLQQKWNANLFLSKWLSYCIVQGHQFRYATGTSAQRGDLPAELA